MRIIWTDYMKYRAALREFDLSRIEGILRYSQERYLNTVTECTVAVGRQGTFLVMVPFEQAGERITPVTAHRTSRQLISLRVRSGRFTHE